MGRILGLGKAVDSADDRAMIKPKPSLPANSQNQGDNNTMDYVIKAQHNNDNDEKDNA